VIRIPISVRGSPFWNGDVLIPIPVRGSPNRFGDSLFSAFPFRFGDPSFGMGMSPFRFGLNDYSSLLLPFQLLFPFPGA
jgi:hypothetical protein